MEKVIYINALENIILPKIKLSLCYDFGVFNQDGIKINCSGYSWNLIWIIDGIT